MYAGSGVLGQFNHEPHNTYLVSADQKQNSHITNAIGHTVMQTRLQRQHQSRKRSFMPARGVSRQGSGMQSYSHGLGNIHNTTYMSHDCHATIRRRQLGERESGLRRHPEYLKHKQYNVSSKEIETLNVPEGI